MDKNFEYEIWATVLDANKEDTGMISFLGMAMTAEEAVNHAKKFYDLECIFGDMVSEELYEEESVEVRVDKHLDNDEYENVYAVRLYQDGTSEIVQDFKE